MILERLCLLCVVGSFGCGAGASSSEDAAADGGRFDSMDSSDGEAGSSEAGEPTTDAGALILPDAEAAEPVLCRAAAAPDPGGDCPVRLASEAGPCGDEGSVIFDGVTCALATGTECSDELGTFDTFEECALACSAAGRCDSRKLYDWGLSCDIAWLHLHGGYPIPGATCSIADGWDCTEPAPEPEDGEPGLRCWKQHSMTTPAFMEQVCALTLMPSVVIVECYNTL